MDVGVLREYLVKLNFGVNTQQLNQVESALKKVSSEVESHTEGIASAFVKVAATITAAYAAIGTATVALMDKVSQAELGYQLFSTRMYMATDAGKKLSIAMDALGHSIDEIAWNPELQERFHQLIEDQKALQSGLGPDYQQRMRELRDFRFEFTRVQVALQYLGMSLVNNLAKAFGLDDGKLKGWVNWLIDNVPILAQKFATFLVPILQDTWSILKNLYEIGSSVALVLANVVETIWKAFGGDASHRIDQQRTALEKFAVTIDEISRAIANLFGLINRHKTAFGILFGAAEGAGVGALIGPEGSLAGAGIGALLGGIGGGLLGHAASDVNGPSSTASTDAADHARKLAVTVSSQTGIPADWIFAQWAHETDFFRSRAFREQNNLAGMREGLTYRSFGNMDESAEYFAKLLMSPRYRSAREANSMEGYAYGLKQGGYYEDTYANYSRGMNRWEPRYAGGTTVIDVGGVHVNQPGASAEEVANHVVRRIDERYGAQTQRQLTELGGVYR